MGEFMLNISILMSLYQRESVNNLCQCLQSIVQCNNKNNLGEIIIVYDGFISKNLNLTVKNFIPYLPIRIIQLPKNVGLGKALNEGLKHCSHEWVFRMDTDDICAPDRFEKQIAYIQAHPEVDIFSTTVTEFNEVPEQPTAIKSVPLTHNEIVQFAQWRSPFNHMSVAYKKSVIEFVGGYQHHLWMEDYNLWLRVLAAGFQSANLSDSLVYARTGKSMISRRRGWQYVQSEWQLFQLKRQLNFQKRLPAFIIFLIRAIPRLLPVSILALIYKYLRKKS